MLSLSVLAGDPIAQMTFRVTDDFGNVVTGAPVTVSTFLRWVPGSGFGHDVDDSAKGVTDTNGVVVLKLPSKTGNMRYSVLAEGMYFDNMNKMKVSDAAYYRDMGGTLRFTNSVDGKWQPWNLTVDLQIKKVLNPIPMYARFLRSGSFPIPAYNSSLGYDLIKSDWLPPYGKGETVDFIFRLDCQLGTTRADGIQLFDAVLTLSFTNNGDGIQEVVAPLQAGSVLRLSRFAPEMGYASNWVSKTFAHGDGDYCEYKENQSFYYRVRTRKDEGGLIISALYGKIIGPLFYEVRKLGANMQMRYYLNPTPNDRNLEFDPNRNLLFDLPSLEQIKEP